MKSPIVGTSQSKATTARKICSGSFPTDAQDLGGDRVAPSREACRLGRSHQASLRKRRMLSASTGKHEQEEEDGDRRAGTEVERR